MRYAHGASTGRHRRLAADVPRVSDSARSARLHRRTIAAAAASVALVSSLLFALPANAAEPFSPAAPTWNTATGRQNLSVAGGIESPTVEQGTYQVSVKAPRSTNVDWAELVLEDGGWPTSTNNITIMLQWMQAENGPQSWWTRNNPLNNGFGSGGGAGLGSYPNLVVAASYLATNLQRGGSYAPIVADLAASASPATTAAAIWASSWAGGHYDYGSHWHTNPVPTVAAPASDW